MRIYRVHLSHHLESPHKRCHPKRQRNRHFEWSKGAFGKGAPFKYNNIIIGVRREYRRYHRMPETLSKYTGNCMEELNTKVMTTE